MLNYFNSDGCAINAILASASLLSMASTTFKLSEYFFSSFTFSSRVRLGNEALIDFIFRSVFIFSFCDFDRVNDGDGVRTLKIDPFVILRLMIS